MRANETSGLPAHTDDFQRSRHVRLLPSSRQTSGLTQRRDPEARLHLPLALRRDELRPPLTVDQYLSEGPGGSQSADKEHGYSGVDEYKVERDSG